MDLQTQISTLEEEKDDTTAVFMQKQEFLLSAKRELEDKIAELEDQKRTTSSKIAEESAAEIGDLKNLEESMAKELKAKDDEMRSAKATADKILDDTKRLVSLRTF